MAISSNKKDGGSLKAAKNAYGKKIVKAAKAYNKGTKASAVNYMSPTKAQKKSSKIENKMRNKYDKSNNKSLVAKGYFQGLSDVTKGRGVHLGEGMRGGIKNPTRRSQVKSMARIQKVLGKKK